MQYVTSGVVINVRRCADVLDSLLIKFNEQTGIPDKVVAWNEAGGNRRGPLEFPERGRLIFDVTQYLTADKKMLYTVALLENKDEKERAPVVFISMQSPSLDIPMRLEIPLRALVRGGPPLRGTYAVYLHSLIAENGEEFIYYGITKRGWSRRFAEHVKAAMRDSSRRSFPQKLRKLTDARAKELFDQNSQEREVPSLAGIVSALCAVGLDRESALATESHLIQKYSLSSKFMGGLNMVSGKHTDKG